MIEIKKILFVLIAVICVHLVHAQNDTMYVMKDGIVVGEFNVKTEVDSIIFYKPETTSNHTFIDVRDGNIYKTVTIAHQTWMAENLRYVYSVVGSSTGSKTSPYYYVYGYQGINVSEAMAATTKLGVLYNWTAAMAKSESTDENPSNVQGVCPTGWHLPSDVEWTELIDYLGGGGAAGGKLKDSSSIYWNNPNSSATDEFGFGALPGGSRSIYGDFEYKGNWGYYWIATESSFNNAWYRVLSYSSSTISRYEGTKEQGFSVRCVKD